MEACHVAAQGRRSLPRAARLARETRNIADRTGDAYLLGWAITADGFVDYFGSRLESSLQRFRLAEETWRGQEVSTVWEIAQARLFRLFSLLHMGAIAELSAEYDRYFRDAQRRGDRYVETTLRRSCNVVFLAAGQPEQAREVLAGASWTPPEGGYHVQHWFELKALGELALYERTASRALSESQLEFDEVARSLLTHVQFVRAESRWLRGRVLLAATGYGPSRLEEVQGLVRQLERERVGYASVWALLLSAGIAAQKGNTDSAIARLRNSLRVAERQSFALAASAARIRCGHLLGGDEGRTLVEVGELWMKEQGIAEPERLLDVVAPGFHH
jgi:hypothetical protein